MKRRNSDHIHCECVAGLEADVRDLKLRLAQAAKEPVDHVKGKIKRTGDTDWMDDLAEQDRKFFQRKLGMNR